LPSLKKNLAYNYLLSFSQVFLPLISIPWVSRALDPDGIGRVGFIDSFTYYFITIAEFGIMVYGIRAVARVRHDKERLPKLVSELMALHVVSSSLALVLYIISVYSVWEKINDVRLLMFSLSFLLVNFFACEWYFLGMEEFKYITMRSLLTRIAGMVCIFLLINEREDYYIYYGIISCAAIVNSVWNNIILFRKLPISFRKVQWWKHIRYTWVTFLISLTYSVTLLLDNVLLRLMSTDAAVGYYSFSMKMAKTAALLLTDALLVFFPRIVSFIQEDKREQLNSIVLRTVQLIIVIAVPVCTGLFLLSHELVMVFLGEKFLPAVNNLRILSFFPILRGYNLFLSKQVLIPYNKERLYLISLACGAALFIPLTLVLSYLYADIGACYALLGAELLTLSLNYNYAKRTDPLLSLFDQKGFFQCLVCAALFFPVIMLLRFWLESSLVIIITSIAICATLYFASLTFVFRNEFASIVKMNVLRQFKKSFS
jgi:O-antigen/teichoic acid export membrane protein